MNNAGDARRLWLAFIVECLKRPARPVWHSVTAGLFSRGTCQHGAQCWVPPTTSSHSERTPTWILRAVIEDHGQTVESLCLSEGRAGRCASRCWLRWLINKRVTMQQTGICFLNALVAFWSFKWEKIPQKKSRLDDVGGIGAENGWRRPPRQEISGERPPPPQILLAYFNHFFWHVIKCCIL